MQAAGWIGFSWGTGFCRRDQGGGVGGRNWVADEPHAYPATQSLGRSSRAKGYPFFKPPRRYLHSKELAGETGRDGGVLQHSVQKGTEVRAAIGATHDNARLRLASQAARVVVLDWQVVEERIHWDGAVDILPFPLSNGHPQAFLDAVTRAGRDALTVLLEDNSPYSAQFELNLEVASALGAVGFTFAGSAKCSA
jgi:hypothetical protein